MATGDEAYLDAARKYYELVLAIYKDSLADPFKITPKSYAETRNMKSLAEPMIMLNVTSIMRDADKEGYELYNSVITELIEDIRAFYKPEYNALFESVTVDNEVVLESAPCRVINPGHDI